jgi:hypothetical protein
MTKVSDGKLIHIAIDVSLVSSSTAALFKMPESAREKGKIIREKGTPKNCESSIPSGWKRMKMWMLWKAMA